MLTTYVFAALLQRLHASPYYPCAHSPDEPGPRTTRAAQLEVGAAIRREVERIGGSPMFARYLIHVAARESSLRPGVIHRKDAELARAAFRAPTLYQRGSVYGPDLSKPGVKALDAERGHNAEIGLKFAMGDHEASITTYRNRVGNLIVFGAAGSCGSSFGCYENVSQALLKGTSLAGRARLGVVNLSATLDFQSPLDASTGKLLARRAKRLATLRADTELAGWQLGAGVQAAGQRFDNAANTKPLAGYALVTLDAAYRLQKDLKLQVNIDNATNRDYQTAGGFASQPRTVVLSLRWSPQL
jgi:vitamin B12 transporter